MLAPAFSRTSHVVAASGHDGSEPAAGVCAQPAFGRSAAGHEDAAGRRVIAVVLSGQGHDGASAATVVHRFGGTGLALDEASSHAFSMPSAKICRGYAIDHALDLDLDLDLDIDALSQLPSAPHA